MADSKKYDGSTWEHSLRKQTTATEAVENPLYSDGTAITSYTISGNTAQNGTPTPSNPVDVNGVGERTENLVPPISSADGWVIGYIRGGGTYVEQNNNNEWLSPFIDISDTGTTFTISADDSTKLNSMSVYWYRSSGAYITASNSYNYDGAVFNAPSEAVKFRFAIRAAAKTEQEQIASGWRVWLNTGSTAKPYEPYGYKIPISSGGVTTNIYLGSTQTVRRIKKLVFDGTEDWRNTFGVSLFGVQNMLATYPFISQVQAYCTHCTYNPVQTGIDASTGNGDIVLQKVGSDYNVYIKNTDYTTNEDFKAWLATQYANGKPVTLYYVLATAETAAVNEPLMKIGDYADTLSNATVIPTTEGANSITVDTTVQPSEFTATWTGWHDASVKEKSENYLDENDFGLVEVAAGTYRVGTDVGVLPSGKYTFNAVKSSSAVQIYRTTKNGSTYNYEAISELPYTFTADGVSNQIFRSAGITGSSWAGLGYSDIMLSTGETAQTYEPYWQ